MNSTRFAIAALMFVMVNAVLFGVGLITVLTIPAFAAHTIGKPSNFLTVLAAISGARHRHKFGPRQG